MWVCIRPRGGQECYLLTCEITESAKLCPIHRFDRLNSGTEFHEAEAVAGMTGTSVSELEFGEAIRLSSSCFGEYSGTISFTFSRMRVSLPSDIERFSRQRLWPSASQSRGAPRILPIFGDAVG